MLHPLDEIKMLKTMLHDRECQLGTIQEELKEKHHQIKSLCEMNQRLMDEQEQRAEGSGFQGDKLFVASLVGAPIGMVAAILELGPPLVGLSVFGFCAGVALRIGLDNIRRKQVP